MGKCSANVLSVSRQTTIVKAKYWWSDNDQKKGRKNKQVRYKLFSHIFSSVLHTNQSKLMEKKVSQKYEKILNQSLIINLNEGLKARRESTVHRFDFQRQTKKGDSTGGTGF